MRKHLTLLIGTAFAAAASFAQTLPLPTMAGGPCGIVKQVPMPKVKSQLLYWRCPDGREVYFHVRDAWLSGVQQDADRRDENRAEFVSLYARSQADNKVDALMRREVLRALARVRAETV